MLNGKPLFCGKEDSQLEIIFKTLGKPELTFPAIQQLDGWKPEYKQIVPKYEDDLGLEQFIAHRDQGDGSIDLLKAMLV